MNIEWNNKYLIGIEKIDNQHKQLVQQVNIFFNCVNKKKGRDKVLEILEYLSEYVEEHFKDEENLQKQIKYPDYEEHKNKHENFKTLIIKLKDKIIKTDIDYNNILETNQIITKWIINHIYNSDKKIGEYIKKIKS
ncbi:MAG: hemerythrin family protein [Spirochaetia bacterium]|nr:hemerythrin family protein [Spirochaetia bacterium]